MGALPIRDSNSVEVEANPRVVWMVTAAVSVLAHAVAIAVAGSLVAGLDGSGLRLGRDLAGFRVDDGLTFVDLDVAIDPWAAAASVVEPTSVVPTAPEPTPPAPEMPVAPAGAPGDFRHLTERPAPPNRLPGPPLDPRHTRDFVGASDRGAGLGRPIEDAAWRRDTSTAHQRLSDGADTYQPPRERTSRDARPSSPQGARREPAPGEGDSAHTSVPEAPAPLVSDATTEDPQATAPPARRTREAGDDDPSAPTDAADDDTARRGPRHVTVASRGPLDADLGPRLFDVTGGRARVPTDDRDLRAASRELHPSILDLSLAAAAGTSTEGRGPGETPGALTKASRGLAAAMTRPHGLAGGTGDEDSLVERTYNRYNLELRRRVHDAYSFPKDLALRLEQGETIVRFTVAPDGRLSGAAEVVKSSGFVGFDQAALDAVAKALPFPKMPDPAHARPLRFSVRFAASNPVIW